MIWNILVVMQGESGSGKSTLANDHIAPLLRDLGHDVEIFSTDDLFHENGVYNFNPKLLGINHKRNLDRTVEALKAGKTVIVDNTNTQCWEAKGYVSAALALGIPVSFRRATGNYQNTHGVPPDKVAQMKKRLETLTVETVVASKSPF